MGEATPAQSASGPFGPMLGVGLGTMPARVVNGPMGAAPASSRGPAVPQLHNAIVERLRARIELCRRHHSTCENRYQRGQAESSDREHESTLHLLNIVHQGTGTRKTKGGRGANQQPPEYSRSNGEQKEGEQKISTRIALQGSLRRKLEGQAPGPKQNGLSCGFSGSDFKRLRVDAAGLGHGPCNHNLSQPHAAPQGSSNMQRKNYMMPQGVGSDLFNMTLKEMKKEPVEVQSCGQSHAEMTFDFKDEGGGLIDPELQELFDELTKSVPLNDLEFEKMLKQDDTFGLDLGRPSSAGAAAGLCTPMDKPIKTEHSPDFGHVHCGSPQLRPASAGPSFTLTSAPSSTTTTQKVATQAGLPRALPCWPEISHAEQLKQMAANQQQPSSLLHHHHQHHHQPPPPPPPVGLTSWAPAMSSHSATTSSFAQDKVSGGQQRLGSQSKAVNHCIYKPNGLTGSSHHLDMKVLSTKPTLHFSPKAHPSAGQPMSIPVNKTPAQQQQQTSSPCQNQPRPALHFQNQQISSSAALCHQPKLGPAGAGMQFKVSQQRQAVPPGQSLSINGNMGAMSAQSQPRAPAPGGQQKGPAKAAGLQRQLNPQQQQLNVSAADKESAHDQFSRHLTRPPPDYKQPRSMVGLKQGNIFTGPNSSPSSSSSGPEKDLQAMTCQLSSGPASKMSPSPSDRRFGFGTDCRPTSCVGQFQQQNSQIQIGLNQNKSRFLGPNAPGGAFGMNSVAGSRTTADLHASAVPGPSLGSLMTNVTMGWGSTNKQVTTGHGVRRLPNPLQAQGGQMDMPSLQYPQRHVGPPNQVAPDIGMLPLNPPGPRPSQSVMGSPSAVGHPNQASPEQRVPAGSFAEPSPGSNSYHQNNRANRLTFDFLPEGDNTVPGINTDSDFIESLLKSDSGNDDWMKDINLDEILGSHL